MIILATASLAPGSAGAQKPSPGTPGIEVRARSLGVLLNDYWQDHLRHTPEDATTLGDKRYNDRWSDLSVAETGRALLRNRSYVKRLEPWTRQVFQCRTGFQPSCFCAIFSKTRKAPGSRNGRCRSIRSRAFTSDFRNWLL